MHKRRWVLRIKLWWGALVLMLVACGTTPPPAPTITPRPTLEPRTPPTAIPTVAVAGDLTLGEPRTVTLPGGTFVTLLYTADEPQTVIITARALSDDGAGNPLDVVLEVLDADMNHLAYDDDGAASLDGFAPNDAALQALPLVAGDYIVRVNAFNGFQAGDVEVEIREAPTQGAFQCVFEGKGLRDEGENCGTPGRRYWPGGHEQGSTGFGEGRE